MARASRPPVCAHDSAPLASPGPWPRLEHGIRQYQADAADPLFASLELAETVPKARHWRRPLDTMVCLSAQGR
ncbi:hypothetical protein J1614_000152 [Plenodomus biglobosus]|nr:hypothetical protein J1614_000152 [Plenodomus biglobosus]